MERIYCSSVLIALADDEENGLMVLDAGTLEVLFLTFASRWIVVVPAEGEALGVTEYEGHQYHGGFMFLDAGFDLLTVVNVVDLETYVKGVVPYEMNRKFPVEALKAQAVAARTYVVYNMGAYSIYGFDLSDTAECQVYGGILAADEVTDGAVDATRGLLIRYRGEIADIYYSAAAGGSTPSSTPTRPTSAESATRSRTRSTIRSNPGKCVTTARRSPGCCAISGTCARGRSGRSSRCTPRTTTLLR